MKLLLWILLLTVFASNIQSQHRVAFIHGYGFTDKYNTKDPEGIANAVRWRRGGVPTAWRTFFADTLMITYWSKDFINFPTQKAVLLGEKLCQKQGGNNPNADWVLVGHSLGGIVARKIYQVRQSLSCQPTIKGILAVNSPMQGAESALSSYDLPGLISKKETILQFGADLFMGPVMEGVAKVPSYVLTNTFNRPQTASYVDIGVNIFDIAGGGSLVESGVRAAIDALVKTPVNGLARTEGAFRNTAEAIGPNGDAIADINNISYPGLNYKSIIGVERYPIVPRLASGAVEIPKKDIALPFSGGQLTFLTTGQLLEYGNEPQAIYYYSAAKTWYRFKRDDYAQRADSWMFTTFLWSIFPPTLPLAILNTSDGLAATNHMKRYNRGVYALDGLDRTVSALVNTPYRIETHTTRIWQQVCLGTDAWSGEGLAEGFAKTAGQTAIAAMPRCAPGEQPWQYVNQLVSVYIPYKSDGLMSVKEMVWNKAAAQTLNQEQGNGDGTNILYRDNGGAENKGEHTGYNHAEIVSHKRAYTDSYLGFNKGDLAPPMEWATNWAREFTR